MLSKHQTNSIIKKGIHSTESLTDKRQTPIIKQYTIIKKKIASNIFSCLDLFSLFVRYSSNLFIKKKRHWGFIPFASYTHVRKIGQVTVFSCLSWSIRKNT